MKITIDTKEDSPTDIRKVIALLSKMIEPTSNSNIFESSSNTLDIGGSESETQMMSDSPEQSEGASSLKSDASIPTNAFASMFGDNSPSKSTIDEDETPVLGATEEKEDEETHEIMEY